ncbi:PP2C-like domain-containing protein CG9801 isoform X1 [Limulus polyphemus]|uniref:PP2C-like domain-containing protein CG9801 isoform X1 n=1 Tax=Limulus polyphemus TaxID=6850 RepID=A0ABM1T3X3_LIMPO|nr:PP2C-like domain-containing protein CG9801 isoform X1 [Limulus polyphemus]
MPTLREKVAEFLRQVSSGSERGCDVNSSCTSPTTGTFIQKYLNGESRKRQPEIFFGKSCYELPVKEISKLSDHEIAAFTGPSGGLIEVNRVQRAFQSSEPDVDFIDEDSMDSCNNIENVATDNQEVTTNGIHPNESIKHHDGNNQENTVQEHDFPEEEEYIAGVKNWNKPSSEAYGIATTLYECHPVTRENAGEPIADAFGVCLRENSAILVLADGVNWGEKSCLAARCAVHGCMDYLNKALYREGGKIETTLDIFICLLRSFHAAHNLILQEDGMLTTLCAAVLCQMKDSNKFIVCTCNVGDSLAYVYSKKYGVREITQGSHDIYSMRDMRDALGALGPVDGQNPELSNLTVAMTIVDPGDIVFLTSDGISDNFDPVVGKFALPKKTERTAPKATIEDTPEESKIQKQEILQRANSNGDEKHSPQAEITLPMVEAHQRHELTLLRMEDLLTNGVNEGDKPCETARQLCEQMIDFATKLTVAKRRILEDPELYKDNAAALNQLEQRRRRRKVGEKLAMVPGKLDHATVVSCKAGIQTLSPVTTLSNHRNSAI